MALAIIGYVYFFPFFSLYILIIHYLNNYILLALICVHIYGVVTKNPLYLVYNVNNIDSFCFFLRKLICYCDIYVFKLHRMSFFFCKLYTHFYPAISIGGWSSRL